MSTSPTPAGDDPARLYRDTVMRHAQEPVGFNKPISVTHQNEQFNPLCGDRITLMLQMTGEQVLDAAFEGESCAICKASASMLCELAPGRTRTQLEGYREWLDSALAGREQPAEHTPLAALLGVRAYPSRIKCAVLPWEALRAAFGSGSPD